MNIPIINTIIDRLKVIDKYESDKIISEKDFLLQMLRSLDETKNKLIESLIIKSIDNVDLDKFLFFTDQLRILNKTHKRLVHIKYFKITN